MADIEEAKRAWEQKQKEFVKRTPTRVAYLGDGRGNATSNMIYPANQAYVYARDSLGDRNFFPVLNRNVVRTAFNLPVILGFTQDEPHHEQVLSIHWASFEHQSGASIIGGGGGPHGSTHEFGGGDEVFIDPRQWQPGLVKPTVPPSMQLTVHSFIYFYDKWERFEQADTIDLTPYIPASNGRYVTIALDPTTGTLVYRPGPTFTGASWADYYSGSSGFDKIPAPSGDEIPLCAVVLTPTTTTLNWNSVTTDNLYDARLHIGFPVKKVLDRLEQLEGLSGNNPSLPMMGVAERTTDNALPTADGATYTVSNLTKDRSYDANSTTTEELADILGTLIEDLRGLNLIS